PGRAPRDAARAGARHDLPRPRFHLRARLLPGGGGEAHRDPSRIPRIGSAGVRFLPSALRLVCAVESDEAFGLAGSRRANGFHLPIMRPPFGNVNVLELIGHTPLVHLRRPSEEAGAFVYGKCEFLNPGLSLKDRTALFIVEAAARSGALKPGGTIVEG